MIDKIGVCVVIDHCEDGWSWEIRWSDGREPMSSKWIYLGEQIAIDEAWDAVCAGVEAMGEVINFTKPPPEWMRDIEPIWTDPANWRT